MSIDTTTSILLALDEGDVQPLRTLLSAMPVDVDAVRRIPRGGDVGGAHRSGVVAEKTAREITATLAVALDRAARQPRGAALLALYLLHESGETWERSYWFDPIQAGLRALADCWEPFAEPESDDSAVMAAVLAACALMDQEITVEGTLITASLPSFATAAEQATRRALRLETTAQRIRAIEPRLFDYLEHEATSAVEYYRPLAVAAGDANRLLTDPTATMGRSVELLRNYEETHGQTDEIRRAEIRAHRLSVQALARLTAEEWMVVDEGRIIYSYPFGIRGLDGPSVVERVKRDGAGWVLAGVHPAAVRGWLGLDDMWEGSDFRRRRFDGAAIELPPVELHDIAGQSLGTLQAEIRLSYLGNHSLRLEGILRDAGPQDVYAAMFRAAPQHGRIRVTCGAGSPVFDRIASFAIGLVNAIPDHLAGTTVSARRGMYHVVLSVGKASLGKGPAAPAESRRPVTDARELTGAAGAQALFHPVVNTVGSLVEWSRYQVSDKDVIEHVGRDGDLVVRTCNTTVVVMPGAPGFVFGLYESVAEFVATVEGLFAAWHDELVTYYEQLAEVESDPAKTRRRADDGGQGELERLRVRLQNFVADARSVLALIRSPALVGSPVDAETVARFLAVAGFDRARAEFNTKVDEILNDRLTRATALADQRRAEAEHATELRTRRQRARQDALLAGIAAAGVSGALQLLQAGFGWRELMSSVLFVTVFVAAIGVWLIFRSRDR